LHGASLHAGKRLADFKTKTGVQRKRAIVKRSLHQPDSGSVAVAGSVQNRLHELPTGAAILTLGLDRNGANTGDDRTFVEAVAANDTAGGLGPGKIGCEAVALTDVAERTVANLPADGRVFGLGGANDQHI